jgi:hypothetical protein
MEYNTIEVTEVEFVLHTYLFTLITTTVIVKEVLKRN